MARWSTSKYNEILMDSLQEYVKANSRKRSEIIKELKEKIRNVARDANESLPEELGQKIRNWLHNHRRAIPRSDEISESDSGARPLENTSKRTRWTLQSVVEHYHKDQIKRRAEELAEKEKATSIAKYRKARTQISEELPHGEKVKYKALAEEWNAKHVPVKVQRELASRKFMRDGLKFTRLAKEQMGVEMFIMAGWQDEKGDIKKAKIHTPGPSTDGFNEMFQKVGGEVWEEWDKYLGIKLSECESVLDEPETSLLKKGTDNSVPWNLPTNSDGWPILPLELDLSLPQLKEILRSFVTITYRNSTNNRRVSVPWQQIQDDSSKFISCNYLPQGVQLREPSKMHSEDIHKLFNFFKRRQALGQKVLRFQYIIPLHQKGTPKLDIDDGASSDSSTYMVKMPIVKKGNRQVRFVSPVDESEQSDSNRKEQVQPVNVGKTNQDCNSETDSSTSYIAKRADVKVGKTRLVSEHSNSRSDSDSGLDSGNCKSVVGEKEEQKVDTINDARELVHPDSGRTDQVGIQNFEEGYGLKKRKRERVQHEDDLKRSYRTRSKGRESMEAKKMRLRPRTKK